jgi:hypothetical protein
VKALEKILEQKQRYVENARFDMATQAEIAKSVFI